MYAEVMGEEIMRASTIYNKLTTIRIAAQPHFLSLSERCSTDVFSDGALEMSEVVSWSGCVHVIWAARALENYAGAGIRVAENARCTIDGIQEHVTYLWTHTRQLGLRCVHMNFEVLLCVDEDDFDRL